MLNFKNSNQVKSFLKKESIRLKINIQNTYTTFISRTFLEKLSQYNNNRILLKGSASEVCHMNALVRSIVDLDLASFEDFDSAYSIYESIFNEDNHENQFNFSLKKDIYTTPTGIKKLSLVGSFDKIKQPLGIDHHSNYYRVLEPTRKIMPKIFEGDEEFEVYVPSYEEYLAEKLCIIVESNKEDVLNTRVKDFYDIYELHGGKYDNQKLAEYFAKMIKLRNKINIDDVSTLILNDKFIEEHSSLWDSTKKRYDFRDQDISLYGAVYYTRAVLREQLQKLGEEMPSFENYQKTLA